MRLDAFDYELPESLIAQHPLDDRAASRLMVVDRLGNRWEHAYFRDLPRFVGQDDVLVLNRSRVIPARLFLHRPTGGRVELVVSRVLDERTFLALGRPLRKLGPGDELKGIEGSFRCRIVERRGDREIRARLLDAEGFGGVMGLLARFGHVPLPPYIDRLDEPLDRDRYQTVFAREAGSVAAPTAGLHFTKELISELVATGTEVLSIVLHVGPGTFLPLEGGDVEENALHAEQYEVDGGMLSRLRRARRDGRRVTAVGTTSARVLETLNADGLLAGEGAPTTVKGETSLFIYPGFEFGVVDQLITNFHLPMSSLFVLVCAFLGTERALDCYHEAIRRRYRFYTYGDVMLIR